MLENFNGEFIYQETLIIFLNFNTKALKEEKKNKGPGDHLLAKSLVALENHDYVRERANITFCNTSISYPDAQ